MNTALWVLQAILALAFVAAGSMKVSRRKEALAGMMPWVEEFSPAVVKLIGSLELLGAVGLILPALTGILPWLTPLAASGLALTMLGANITHIRRGEFALLVAPVVLLVLAVITAYGRFVISPL